MNALLSVWDALHGDWIRGVGELGLMWGTAAAFAALPLAVIALLVNLLGRRWMSAGQLGILWCLVLARLLFPSAPASPFSLQNLLSDVGPWRMPEAPGRMSIVIDEQGRRGIDVDMSCPDALDSGEHRFAAFERLVAEESSATGPVLSHPTTMPIPGPDWDEFLTAIVEVLWLPTAVGILFWTLFVHWRFTRSVRRTDVCRDERLLRLWDDCCASANVRSRPPIIIFYGVQQPAVTGLLYPELLLPPEAVDLSDEELRMIMLHELAHVRRWDIAVNWGLVILRALHWWNPLYWLASARFRSLREQACDAFVLRTLQGQTPRDYSELLLKLAQHVSGRSRWKVLVPASLLGFFESYFRKRDLRRRLKALRSAGVRRSRWSRIAFGTLVVLAALCGLTDAEPVAPALNVRSANTWLPPGTELSSMRCSLEDATTIHGPHEVRTYGMDEIVRHSTPAELEHAGGRKALAFMVGRILAQTKSAEERRTPGEISAPGEVTPGGSYVWDKERLIVRASKALHDELAGWIEAWELSGLAQISIGCRVMTASTRELAGAAGINWTSLASETGPREEPLPSLASENGTVVRAFSRVEDHVPVFVASLSEDQVKSITELAQTEPKALLMFSPTVTVFNGQEATISDCTSRPFVVGLDEPPNAKPQARIENIHEGTTVRLRPMLSQDRKHIRLAGTIDLSSIVDVAVVEASMPVGVRKVQAPRVRRHQITVLSNIAVGQSLLIRCSPTFEGNDGLYVLLKPHLIELTEEK